MSQWDRESGYTARMDPSAVHDEASAIEFALALSAPTNGHDATVVRIGGGALCISTDSTIAGIHAPHATPPHALGRRAAARALSDLAAAGAAPAGLTCAMHVPAGAWPDAAAALAGLVERAAEQHAPLLGGDFTSTPSDAVALVVTVLGRRAGGTGSPAAARAPTTNRTGFASRGVTRIGDELLVTGQLGAAAAALAAGRPTLPEPPDRLRAGQVLARYAHALIDLSDGLARDASLLAPGPTQAPHIELALLPCAPDANPVLAARGGDDYELLAAIAPDRVPLARAALARACPGLVLTRIGAVADAREVVHPFTLDGAPVSVHGGFLHT